MFQYYLIMIALALVVEAYEIAKPGCPDECGGVKIPFPFGFGQADCNYNQHYLNDSFRIKCDHTTDPPTPYLLDLNGSYYKLMSINLDDHTFRVYAYVAFNCYNTINTNGIWSTTPNNKNSSLPIPSMFPFNISATQNKLIAIGCDTTARVWDNYNPGIDSNSLGCYTGCSSVEGVSSRDGSCSGPGCCQTSIFNNMVLPIISVDSMNNHTYVVDFNPCSYAFVGEVGSYEFSEANITVTAENLSQLSFPVVYKWAISSNPTCSELNRTGSEAMLCGASARCVDDILTDGLGAYTCQCMEGYTGNPYLSHGCQDINECVDERLNTCQKKEFCVNNIGGFECLCPHGFHGNGTLGYPCIPDPGSMKLVLGLSMGMGSMIALAIFYGLYKLFKKRKDVKKREHYYKKNGGLLLQQELSTSEGTIDRTKIFTRSELEKATDNFNDNRVLGHGGQGTVYKGMLVDGTIVAVKKSKKVDEHQLSQFINEVAILSQINHRNVVKLFGCCLETEVPMLVYEFVPNGTLYHHIHHPREDFHMTWKVRFQIAVECAEAIAYLHSSCSSPIYHRDIKSSNILLDEKYKAKVSDFGTSRTICVDKTHVTTFVQGTFGYLDPEFFRSIQFSEKSDVYSFGVVLLELITSKKPIFTDTFGEAKGLATEFVQLMESNPNRLHDILDIQVSQNCNGEEIEVLAKLIERCLHIHGRQRPTMRELAIALDTIKSRLDEHNDDLVDQEVSMQQENLMTLANEGLASTMSSFTESSFSIDVEPLLFDSI